MPSSKYLSLALSFLLASILLSACAPKKPTLEPSQVSGPEKVWENFRQNYASSNFEAKGFIFQGSLNLFTPNMKRRVKFSFWGNFENNLRIDLKAGFNTIFAMWQVTPDKCLVYFPRENKAYFHQNSQKLASKMGLEIPFGLRQLAFILSGQFQHMVPPSYEQCSLKPEHGWAFKLSAQEQVRNIIIDFQGRPRKISGAEPFTWEIIFDDYDQEQPKELPKYLSLAAGPSKKAIIRILELDFRPRPWKKSALQLSLPQDTLVNPLP